MPVFKYKMDAGVNIVAILRELLMEYSRVSIPCMGSFIASYHPASPSDDKKLLLPPCKEVIFNPKEIWNDERLERKLAQNISCSLAKAQEQVALWVDNLCFRLAIERLVQVEGLGTFTLSDSDQIGFTFEKNINLLKEAYGLGAVPFSYIPVTTSATAKNVQPKKRSYAWLIFIIILVAVATVVVLLYKK